VSEVVARLSIEVAGAEFARTGLVRVDWALASDEVPIGAHLEVSFDCMNDKKPTLLQITPGQRSGWFGVHSHLLPNGQRDIHVSLLDGLGQVLDKACRSFKVSNNGQLADDVRYSLSLKGVPLVFMEPCDTRMYDYADASLWPWFDRPDAHAVIGQWRSEGRIDEACAGLLTQFVDKGYVVLNGLISSDEIVRVNTDIDRAVSAGLQGYSYGSSQRIEKLHELYPAVRELWLNRLIFQFLDLLFQVRARPCQSLTYVFGSQQDAHQDTIHLTPFPAGYMCGVWVALEDVHQGSGELEVYPGSHRLPRVTMQGAACKKVSGDWSEFVKKVCNRWNEYLSTGNFEKIVYRPKAGDVLIWHENLMHAGSVRKNQSISRRSIVSHVFAEGAVVFYDSSGLIGYVEPLENMPAPA
jgi:hypothetical protein